MKKIVRESKFRHLYGQQSPKDQLFDGINASDTRLEGNICAVNRKFIACVLSSSGAGFFTVLRRDKPGRVDRVFRCLGHSSEITDLSFDRYNPNRISSGSDDGSFIVWWIPEAGLTEDLSEFQCQLKASQRRAVQSEWHPSAADILIGVNVDSINIFNVGTEETIRSIDTSSMSDQIFNISLNYNGTKVAATFKDKKLRIFDLMNGNKVTEFNTHGGSKTIKCAWVTQAYDDDIIVTTGATKMSAREICAWKISKPDEPIATENLGNASASLYVFYDNDTKLLIFFGKGEGVVKFYEIDQEPEWKFHNVATFSAQDAHRCVAIGNKLSCSFSSNEVLHGVRVLAKALEEVAFIVPRKSELFQDDLFPNSISETPAMTAADFASGKVCDPLTVSLKDYVFPDGSVPVSLKSAASAGKKSVATGKAGPSGQLNIVDLSTELSQVKSDLEELKSRVAALEKK